MAAQETTIGKQLNHERQHRTTHKVCLISAAENIDSCSLFELAAMWMYTGEGREMLLHHLEEASVTQFIYMAGWPD